MNYTHQIITGINGGLKCFIYKNIQSNREDDVYIRTEDNRAFWIKKNELKELPLSQEELLIEIASKGTVYEREAVVAENIRRRGLKI